MNELVSSGLHLCGAVAVILATPHLVRTLGYSRELRIGAQLQSACIAFLLVASCAYHFGCHYLGEDDELTLVLVRIDRAGVWVIFAGFFILPHLILERGAWRWAPLALSWTIATVGAAIMLAEYVPMSAAQLALPYALASVIGMVSTARFVLRRGARQSAGLLLFWVAFVAAALCFVFKVPNVIDGWVGPHEVWHLGILLGIGAHWHFMLDLREEAALAFPEVGALAPVRIEAEA